MSGGAWLSAWLVGRTAEGRTVRIDRDPYSGPRFLGGRGARIEIDGEEAQVTERVVRYRDGGTTIVQTDRGRIVFPHRMTKSPRPPTLDGYVLEGTIR